MATMTSIRRRVGLGIATLALSAGVTAVMPTNPAHAAGWLGPCYPQHNATSAGGWCDGNGPDHGYQTRITCTNGRVYYGPSRWAGDTRGSWAWCPTGSFLNYGYLASW